MPASAGYVSRLQLERTEASPDVWKGDGPVRGSALNLQLPSASGDSDRRDHVCPSAVLSPSPPAAHQRFEWVDTRPRQPREPFDAAASRIPATLRDRLQLTRLLDDPLKEELLQRLDGKISTAPDYRRPSWGDVRQDGDAARSSMRAADLTPLATPEDSDLERFERMGALLREGGTDALFPDGCDSAEGAAAFFAASRGEGGEWNTIGGRGSGASLSGQQEAAAAALVATGVGKQGARLGRRRREVWTVGDRVLGFGPLHPDGVAAIWTLNEPLQPPRMTHSSHSKKAVEEDVTLRHGDTFSAGASSTAALGRLGGSQSSPSLKRPVKMEAPPDALEVQMAVAAARQAAGPEAPARGSRSLLRASLRHMLQV
eukprot:TRINITY_DN53941_c0_g1_i1.p1 TRINITY_DN53941_c0_g1~~TRINITY_DN53941_c0_g1_i1.p1  ORF type:complete len:372 (+),score=75.10 TRINITY_DN53941_c0_g1_i1:71-1186(+)